MAVHPTHTQASQDTILATDGGRRVCPQGAQAIIREPERRTDAQRARAKARHPQVARGPRYHAELSGGGVAVPVDPIHTHAHGFQAGHGGVDLICDADDVVYAICDATVIHVRAGG